MSQQSKDPRAKLLNLRLFLAEDIEDMNDAGVREVLHDIGISSADALVLARAALSNAQSAVLKHRFEKAKAGLRASVASAVVPIDVAHARKVVSAYFARNPDAAPLPSTLAARKGGAMSDEMAVEIYDSLVELGAIPKDGKTD